MKEKKAPNRPLCLELADTEKELLYVINNAMEKRKIPAYLLEPLVANIHCQVSNGAQSERESAAQHYARQMAEYEASKSQATEEEGGDDNGP